MKNINKTLILFLAIGMIAVFLGAFFKINGKSCANDFLVVGMLLQFATIGGLIFINRNLIKQIIK